jgi:hypothetical protein
MESSAEVSPYVAPAFGLVGVVVGGVIAGVVAFILDRQRRVHDDRVRREQWERDDALQRAAWDRDNVMRRRDRMYDLYTRVFALWETSGVAIARLAQRPSTSQGDVVSKLHEKLRKDGENALLAYHEGLANVAADMEALAPPPVRESFHKLRRATEDLAGAVLLDGLDGPKVAHSAKVAEVERAAVQLKMHARNDLEHNDLDYVRKMAALEAAIAEAEERRLRAETDPPA